MKHAGECGVQLSIGIEVEDYGDQAAAASDQFLGRSQPGNPEVINIEWYILVRSDRGHLIISNFFSRFD